MTYWQTELDMYRMDDPEYDLEPDPDLDKVLDDEDAMESDWWHDLDPWGDENDEEWIDRHMNEHGLTGEGQDYLSARDEEGDFV